jgi:hypothetical protein
MTRLHASRWISAISVGLLVVVGWAPLGPAAAAAPVASATATYNYDVASNSSESTFWGGATSTAARVSTNTSSAPSTGDFSAVQPVFVAAESGGPDLAAAEQAGGHTIATRGSE